MLPPVAIITAFLACKFSVGLSRSILPSERKLLSGVVAPYWDPDRRSRASATFSGQLTGDTIEGTFTTTYANGDPQTGGRWHVRRTR